ncbi:hypothetical protein Aspvir_008483 [Aspergillus viridinutans]|uniref:Uncharacterized protein n=1 Tax=Aspergillus viridinutans TaxID=75553 RepID=A0A9P3BWT0_ASPVI|nr:uncharacterized protein Aspvir_008483 [Aspergillus viridinutans]GIK04400.1 hypothetical protein Aspvir_008483 [Aspergillus viridinutans]
MAQRPAGKPATTTGSSATQKECKAKLLDIFTVHGAQWTQTGAQLVETSKYASDILNKLDAELANLPNEKDRPDCTLREELLADANKFMVGDVATKEQKNQFAKVDICNTGY